MPYAVYILQCSDRTYYTGLAKDLDHRVWEHQTGLNSSSYTFARRPVKLVWSIITESYQEAFQWEHRIKGWSRAKKEALIRGDIDGIHQIVKSERKQREQFAGKHRAERNEPVGELRRSALTDETRILMNLRFVCGAKIMPLRSARGLIYDYQNHSTNIYHPIRRPARQGI